MNRHASLHYTRFVDDLLTDVAAACVAKVIPHPGKSTTAKVLTESGVAHAFATNETGSLRDARSVALLWSHAEWLSIVDELGKFEQ